MKTKTTTRRAVLLGGAAISLAVAATATAAAVADPGAAIPVTALPLAADPIFAAIKRHRELVKTWTDLIAALEEAQFGARAQSGERRPIPLIAWRSYSAIGGSEIEKARDEFLAKPGADPALIEKEYRDAKKRERAKERAGRDWDQRHGIAALRDRCDDLRRQEDAASDHMASIMPTTAAGCGALVAYAAADLEIGDGPEWPMVALATAVRALKTIDAEAVQS